MKKLYFTLAVAALTGSLAASAQQLPNPGFEGDWELNYPWNTICDTLSLKTALSHMGQDVFGMQPAGWVISNVLGVVSEASDDDGNPIGYRGLGSTAVGDATVGYESETAVRLFNSPNPFMSSQIVPAYISLGTSWATNTLDWSTFQPTNKDGGVFGGMKLNSRPDELSFMYKWNPAAATDSATVLVYAWKGHWSQADVPGNNSMSPETVKTTMTDRDRNILDIPTSQGGAVTATDDAELISKVIYYITGAKSEWTNMTLPINYLTDSKPEMVNVVLSSNNYFNSVDIHLGDTLVVDNVKFIYHSRLQSLTINGDEVEFGPDSYELTLDESMPAADAFVAVADGKDAKVDVKLDNANAVATITVSNVAEDFDGKTEHVYTINFKKAAAGDVVKNTYKGTLTVEMMGNDITEGGQDATIEISQAAGSSTCDFLLPNLTLSDLGTLGDIAVSGVNVKTDADGTRTYDGFVESMKLLDGNIDADVKVTGTITKEGDADMTINVDWYLDRNEAPIPILCKFIGKGDTSSINTVTVTDNNAVEMFDLRGNRVNGENLPAGIYIRRQGNTVTKVLVK